MTSTNGCEHAGPRPKSGFSALTHWVNQRLKAWRTLIELNRCNPKELAEIAHDMGISVGDLRQLARSGEDAAERLLKRMAALRLNPALVSSRDPAVMRDLQRLCASCTDKGRCDRDLVRDANDPVWQQYCPNAVTLTALQRQQ